MEFSAALTDLKTLSHAYALEGAQGEHEALLAHLTVIGFNATGNPDAFIRVHEQFGIDESREITRLATRRPIVSPRSIFIITTPSMTAESQHALLKTFEDPASAATFFLIVPSVELLLPTLRSRLQLLQSGTRKISSSTEEAFAKEFLAATPAQRIKLLEALLKERKLGDIIQFLSSLERLLAPLVAEKDAREGLRAVYRARSFSADKGALMKVLLEQVALLVPRKKVG